MPAAWDPLTAGLPKLGTFDRSPVGKPLALFTAGSGSSFRDSIPLFRDASAAADKRFPWQSVTASLAWPDGLGRMAGCGLAGRLVRAPSRIWHVKLDPGSGSQASIAASLRALWCSPESCVTTVRQELLEGPAAGALHITIFLDKVNTDTAGAIRGSGVGRAVKRCQQAGTANAAGP